MDLSEFRQLPLMGIVRGIKASAVEPLVETAVSSGLRAIEITMNTSGAQDLIRNMIALAKDRIAVGAGTVLTMQELETALDAGASFIVSPTLIREVVEHCASRSIPVFPGALTPTEIRDAWQAGATMVKVFPASVFGPTYLKEIKGPFQDIELLACGGVNADNIGAFFANGASAAAFGSSIFNHSWIASSKFERIGEGIERLIEGYRASIAPVDV